MDSRVAEWRRQQEIHGLWRSQDDRHCLNLEVAACTMVEAAIPAVAGLKKAYYRLSLVKC